MSQRICSILDCDSRVYGHDMCSKHYTRWKRHGDPLIERPRHRTVTPTHERFWAKVDRSGPDGCWEWTAARDQDGYGKFSVKDPSGRWRLVKAHRWALENSGANVPVHLVVDHLCRNPSCVNPVHLEAVPQVVNVTRGRSGATSTERAARITHCPHGHPRTPENTYVSPGGYRACRACQRKGGRSRT